MIAHHAAVKKGAGKDVEGIIYTYKHPEEMTKEFEKRFEEITGEGLNNHAENAYDTLVLIKKAIEKAGKYDATLIKDVLYEVGQDYKGVSGTFSFDENGDVERPVDIMQYQNLEPVVID